MPNTFNFKGFKISKYLNAVCKEYSNNGLSNVACQFSENKPGKHFGKNGKE